MTRNDRDEHFVAPVSTLPNTEGAASLSEPLGDRSVTVLGEHRAVFDGATLVEATFVPDRWQAGREGPGYPDPQTSRYWWRSWPPPTAPGRGEACTPSTSGPTLTEGPTDIVDRFPLEMGRPG